MPKWSSNSFPSKYRHLQKRIEAIEEAVNALPKPTIDFFALSSKERDLIDTYYHYIFVLREKQKTNGIERGIDKNKNENYNRELFALLRQTLNEDEISELLILLKNIPSRIARHVDAFWNRDHPPQLMSFLSEQQELHAWIPGPSKLAPWQLTWVAWDELLSLMTKHGYDRQSDDVSKLRPLKQWPMNEKKKIVHLYLEMISSEQIRSEYLAVQDYDGDPPPIRKRLSLQSESRLSRVAFRRKKPNSF